MPVIICPHCDERQTVSRDLAGLSATCSGCGEGIRIPLATPKPPKSASSPKVVIDEPEISGTDLRKTVLLLGGLIVGVLVVLAVLLYAVTPSKKVTPVAPAAATPSLPDRDPVWDRTPTSRDDSHANFTAAGLLGLGIAVVIVAVVAAALYMIAVMAVGVLLAKDAAARGMQTLPWVAAYFVFQGAGPALGLPLMAVFPPVGILAGLAFGLAASWYGGLMYLAVRRPGKKLPCPRCRNPRLKYLVTCPHCGVAEAA